jgi:hypothetical protein
MTIKTEIVVCRASYRKVFSAIFRRGTFSTPTPDFNNQLRCILSLRCYSAGMNPHESAFAESFISKARRERALELLASSKNRQKFTSKFDHHGRDYFIPECIRSIEPRHQHPPNDYRGKRPAFNLSDANLRAAIGREQAQATHGKQLKMA